MADLLSALQQSNAGLRAQAGRLRHISENIANADTPGYRRKTASFVQNHERSGIQLGPVRLDRSELKTVHDPHHPLADSDGNYSSSNVDLIIEVADAREAQRSYEANLRIFDKTRQMTESLFDLIRR